MNQQTRRQTRVTALIVAVALFAALAGQASLAVSGSAIPRLSLGEPPVSQTQGLGELQRSLQQLAGSVDREHEPSRLASSERLQAALTRLGTTRPQSELVSSGPRLTGGPNGRLVQDDATAFSGIVSNLMTAWSGMAAGEARSEAVDVGAVRQAMARFDLVTDAIVSDTFSRVFLGLSDMAPSLSDATINHPKVAKDDLRAHVVNARIGAASTSSFTPSLAYRVPALRPPRTVAVQPDIDVVLDAGSEQIAGLATPVGELALSGMNAAPERPWTDPLSSDEQYAMEEQVDMDEIDMDELGDATLASLESPVDAGELQETRAGFVLNNGVHIDFTVTRLTSVDGLDQLHTITNMPQGLDAAALGQISAGQAGNSNTQVLSPGGGSMFTVIQNGLDNQRILDITTIDVSIKNFGLRSMDYVRPSLQGNGIPAELR